MTYPEPTRSPRRKKIMALVEDKQMTAAQIGEALGISRESAYNVLLKMAEVNQVKKFTRSNQAFGGNTKSLRRSSASRVCMLGP